MKKVLFGAVVFAAAIGVNLLAGCAQIVYPSCGQYVHRLTDGADCRECLDRDGSHFAQCHSFQRWNPSEEK